MVYINSAAQQVQWDMCRMVRHRKADLQSAPQTVQSRIHMYVFYLFKCVLNNRSPLVSSIFGRPRLGPPDPRFQTVHTYVSKAWDNDICKHICVKLAATKTGLVKIQTKRNPFRDVKV